jgi:hypothetical protein
MTNLREPVEFLETKGLRERLTELIVQRGREIIDKPVMNFKVVPCVLTFEEEHCPCVWIQIIISLEIQEGVQEYDDMGKIKRLYFKRLLR